MLLFDISHLHVKELAPGLKGKFILTKNHSVAFWNMTRQTVIHNRECESETLIVVLEGKLMLTINHETCEINPGMGIFLPPNEKYSIRTTVNCSGIDITVPERRMKKNGSGKMIWAPMPA